MWKFCYKIKIQMSLYFVCGSLELKDAPVRFEVLTVMLKVQVFLNITILWDVGTIYW